jgi:protein-tyrosine phosphatase
MAEAILKKSLPQLQVESAGIGALSGHRADPIARTLMAERGISIEAHIAKQVNLMLCQRADVILVMDSEQKKVVESRYPLTRGKVFRLSESDGLDIPDPFTRGQHAFEHALGMIDNGVKYWTERFNKIAARERQVI